MGYYVNMELSDMVIPSDKVHKALAAVNCLEHRHYCWVNNPPEESFATLQEALTEWRYDTEYDEEGNLTILYFNGEKLGDDELLFKTLAPFVSQKGYPEVLCRGEEGSVWRWIFPNGQLKEEIGRIVFG